MNTGHDGSFGSLHANTAQETVTRMINPPMNVPPIMLSGLDLIIIQARLHVNGKTARKITEVAEVAGMEGDKPRLNAIWKYNAATDQIEETEFLQNFERPSVTQLASRRMFSNAMSHNARPSSRTLHPVAFPTSKR